MALSLVRVRGFGSVMAVPLKSLGRQCSLVGEKLFVPLSSLPPKLLIFSPTYLQPEGATSTAALSTVNNQGPPPKTSRQQPTSTMASTNPGNTHVAQDDLPVQQPEGSSKNAIQGPTVDAAAQNVPAKTQPDLDPSTAVTCGRSEVSRYPINTRPLVTVVL